MCYHTSNPKDIKAIEDEFHLPVNFDEYHPYHHVNGYSKKQIPVATVESSGFILLDWRNPLDKFNTLNGKCEEIFLPDKKFFNKITDRRGIVAVSGFYESTEIPKYGKRGNLLKEGDKFPYFIYLNGKECFGIACLISNFNTISLLTCEANSICAEIHNSKRRMPVILHPEDYKKWLSDDLMKEEQVDLMRPYESEAMNAHPISPLIYSRTESSDVAAVKEKYNYNIPLPEYKKGQKAF